jgi:hypothetical protein
MTNFEKVAYGQFGEDLAIEGILQTHKRINQGTYVDVGAFHPFNHSNTAMLHTRYGWTGINIDANQSAIDEFNHSRPSDINLTALVSDKSTELEYVYFDHPGVNSADPKMIGIQTRNSSPFKEISRETKRSLTLSEILDTHFEANQSFGLLSVDAEGMDLQVLISNDWTRYRPFLVAVETHGMDLSNLQANDIYRFLDDLGYRMVSHIFVTSIFMDLKALA